MRMSLFFVYLISSWFLKSTFWREVGYIFTVILPLTQPELRKEEGKEMGPSPYQNGRKSHFLLRHSLLFLSALNSHVNLI
jgi:hypothetical protein